MPESTLIVPEQILCYPGSRYALKDILPDYAQNILVICGKHSLSQLRDEDYKIFGPERKIHFAVTPAEPEIDLIDQIRKDGAGFEAQAIVGWGGGSAIDAAKAVAGLWHESAPCRDFFYGKNTAERRKIFLAAVPTTAGTGAEVTPNAVLSDRKTGIKQSLRTEGMLPDAAVADADLVQDLPRHIMSASGFDALTQAIESFTSNKATAFTRQLAQTAADELLKNLYPATCRNIEAVRAITRASLNTGLAFARSGLGAVHGLAHPLGSLLHLPHGIACSILLPQIMQYNYRISPAEIDQLALATGFKNGIRLIEQIIALKNQLGLPDKFADAELIGKNLDFILSNCRSGSMKCNPHSICDDDIVKLLEELI